MTGSIDIRRGLVNQGGFFSPYYLFDLLARQHADELDPAGRETNRRLLRRPFRAAWNRYAESGSTTGEAWQAWHRELLEALGFLGDGLAQPPLRQLDQPVETARHGLVPIARAAFAPSAEPGDEDDPEPNIPLVYVDLHGFGTDLDRAHHPSQLPITQSPITSEPVARAVEFALDRNPTRWALVLAGERMRLYRKGGSVARQYLEVNFPALFDGDRDDEWAAFWGLFRYQAFVPDPASGKCLLDRVLEESQRHASRIADDLRDNVVTAVEALIQGVLDDPTNRRIIGSADPKTLQRLFKESLYFLYRLLFILYAESRDLLPVGESPIYRDAYSFEHLRDMAEQPLHAEDADKTYYLDTLRTLFGMLRSGFPTPGSGVNPGFTLPAFNGRLFDARRTPLLERCRIPDRAMRQVVRELSLSRPKRRNDRRERYSYADLGVDQLGSIYEGLLVYEPAIVQEDTVVARVKGEERLVSLAQAEAYGLELVAGPDGEAQRLRPGAFVLRLWGGRRKGSGSYYTMQEITAFLVRQALEPLIEPIVQGCGQRDAKGRPLRDPDEILAIKCCDPAMGSGAFLIQACRYLAEAYGRARIAAGLDEDSRMDPAEFARYKRRVAETCLYGVDINPLAVELAKVSLWLETLAVDRPLTFLDAHLACGNSLVGAPLRNEAGEISVAALTTIPDAALQEVSKEATAGQKAAARARVKRNQQERKRLQPQRAGQLPLGADWGVLALRQVEDALTDTLSRRRDLERSDADLPLPAAVALVHEKEQLYDDLQHGAASRYRRAREICDLWCAAWFWPETGSEVALETSDGEDAGTVLAPEPPTTQVFLELAGYLLGTDEGSLSAEERDAYLAVARHVAGEQRFFHWDLEFPEVFTPRGDPKGLRRDSHSAGSRPQNPSGLGAGFDAQVGNPPWETVKPNSQEFWSNYDPLFRNLNRQQALRCAEQMRANPVVDAAWRDYEHGLSQAGQFFKESGHYRSQGRGDTNTYKLFLERSLSLLGSGGGLGMVLPSGVYTDLGSKELRQLLFETCQIGYLLALVNERFIFPAVDHRFRFVLLTAQRGRHTEALQVLFRLNIGNAVRPDELAGLLANLEAISLRLRLADIRRFSPDSLSLMELRSQREADILERIYDGHPLLGEEVPSIWNLRFATEFHMTNDSHLFNEEQDGLPVWEGKMVHQFDCHFAKPRWYVPETDGRKKLIGQKGDNGQALAYQISRLGFRGVASSTNERTLIAALIPPGAFAEVLLPVAANCHPTVLLYNLTLFNSVVLDFVLRFKVQTRVSNFMLYQLPVPRFDAGYAHFDSLVARSARLACVTSAFAPTWNEVARRYSDTLLSPWGTEHTATDPRERARLRAEIDALVADLYGLSEADFAYILTTFPLLDRDQPALPGEPKSFITRDQALLALFELRGKQPPADVVEFFAAAGADIAAVNGSVRGLAERVAQAQALGAVAHVPSGRGGGPASEENQNDYESDGTNPGVYVAGK